MKSFGMGVERKIRNLVFINCLLLSFLVAPQRATAAQSVTAIDDHDSVWIVGTDVNGYSCWNSSSYQVSLQIQIGNSWISKSKATPKKNSTLCTDVAYPYAAIYHWNVDVLGIPGDGSNKSRILLARQYVAATKKSKAYTGNAFTKELYLSQSDLMSDYSTALANTLSGGSGGGFSAGGTGTAGSKISGCNLKGKRLYGSVYVSNTAYSADFSVYVSAASYLADMNVYKENSAYMATSCGLWYFTNNAYSADFRVYFTDAAYSSDFSIYYTPMAYSAGVSH